MSDQKFIGFRDGQSTRPEVDALNKQFAALKPGDSVSREEIEAVTGALRFRTVLQAWRKSLMDRNIDLQCERGAGRYYAATPGQAVADAPAVFSSAQRKIKRLGHRMNVAAANASSDAERVPVEHIARVAEVTYREMRKQRMNLLPSSAAPEVPRIEPPKAKEGAK